MFHSFNRLSEQGWEAPATILAIFRPYVKEFSPASSAFLGGMKRFLSLER